MFFPIERACLICSQSSYQKFFTILPRELLQPQANRYVTSLAKGRHKNILEFFLKLNFFWGTKEHFVTLQRTNSDCCSIRAVCEVIKDHFTLGRGGGGVEDFGKLKWFSGGTERKSVVVRDYSDLLVAANRVSPPTPKISNDRLLWTIWRRINCRVPVRVFRVNLGFCKIYFSWKETSKY